MMDQSPLSPTSSSRELAAAIAKNVGLAGLDLARFCGRLIVMICTFVIAVMISAMFLDHVYLAGAHEDVFLGLFVALKGFVGPLAFTIFLCLLADRVIGNNLNRDCQMGISMGGRIKADTKE